MSLAGYGQAGSQYGAAGNLGLSGTGQQLTGLGGAIGLSDGNQQALAGANMLQDPGRLPTGAAAGCGNQSLQAQQWDPLNNYIADQHMTRSRRRNRSSRFGSGISETLGGIGSLLMSGAKIAGLFSDRR
jgi:hypothetical protein